MAGRFWTRVSHDFIVKLSARAASSDVLARVGLSTSRWLTHMAGKLVLVVGKLVLAVYFFPTQAV